MDKYVSKKILYAGKVEGLGTDSSVDPSAYAKDWQLTVHFRVDTVDEEPPRVVDDTRQHKPLQLLLGKEFKLEVLEACVKTMAVGEVAEFAVDKRLLHSYPIVMKTLRDSWKPPAVGAAAGASGGGGGGGHCCGMMMTENGVPAAAARLGYDDLDRLLQRPQSLRFTVELLSAQPPGSYTKDAWAMTDSERLAAVHQLRLDGNASYRQHQYQPAIDTYRRALGHLETLMLREKPHDTEWRQLQQLQLPVLLNLAQCLLVTGDNYGAIEHCTTVLQTDADCVKALFRRGRAHARVWNQAEASDDLQRAAQLDTSLRSAVDTELQALVAKSRAQDEQQRQALRGKLFN